MNQFQHVLNTILAQVEDSSPTTSVPLDGSLGMVLAEDIVADMDMPPFDKAAMDGYACKMEDIGNVLHIVESIQAGKPPTQSIRNGQCAGIMTGAPVPPGADCVFMKEDAFFPGPAAVRCTNEKTKRNICYQGEDYKKGDILIKKGTPIATVHIPMLAAAGIAHPAVHKAPRIQVFATGTELVEVGQTPGKGQIRNSNSAQLISLIKSWHLQATYGGILPDSIHDIKVAVQQAMLLNNILVLSGGVSVGDFDLVPELLQELGFSILASKSGIKPGYPMIIARAGTTFCFAFSGNPVSSYLQAEFFLRPFLLKWMGATSSISEMPVPLSIDFQSKKTNRTIMVPIRLTAKGEAEPIEFHGSAHINALHQAFGIMIVPEGTTNIDKGEIVHVRPL